MCIFLPRWHGGVLHTKNAYWVQKRMRNGIYFPIGEFLDTKKDRVRHGRGQVYSWNGIPSQNTRCRSLNMKRRWDNLMTHGLTDSILVGSPILKAVKGTQLTNYKPSFVARDLGGTFRWSNRNYLDKKYQQFFGSKSLWSKIMTFSYGLTHYLRKFLLSLSTINWKGWTYTKYHRGRTLFTLNFGESCDLHRHNQRSNRSYGDFSPMLSQLDTAWVSVEYKFVQPASFATWMKQMHTWSLHVRGLDRYGSSSCTWQQTLQCHSWYTKH